MAHIYKGLIANGDVLLGQVETSYDEWGNKIETATYQMSGNRLANTASGVTPLQPMQSDFNILSRQGSYDLESGITTIVETKVVAYAPSDQKRYSMEAQSSREPITSHPRFDEIAGTPDEPLFDNAVWVAADDAQQTMRFVQLRGEYAGLEQFISGSGALFRVQFIAPWDEAGFAAKLGKIEYPEGSGIWGGTTGWLLVGASAEPFGSQYKHTRVYRLASANASRAGGWNAFFYNQ